MQTPNYWFPIEPHFVFPFFQWFPKSLKIKLITLSDLGGIKKANSYAEAKETIEYNSLLSKKELKKVFKEAGFDFREPGCSACLGMNEDKIPAGKYCISTSNRNFEGRQGAGARTLLASPLTAAVAAITGKVGDVREFLN